MPQDNPNQQITIEEWEERVRDHFKIPKGLWKAIPSQESGGDWDAKSPTGVRGKYQVTERTAKGYNLDRNDPYQQVVAAARTLKDNYDRLGTIKDDRARWLGATGRYYAGDDGVDAQGNLSTGSKDGVSNAAAHVERVAKYWGDFERQAGGVGGGAAAPSLVQSNTAEAAPIVPATPAPRRAKPGPIKTLSRGPVVTPEQRLTQNADPFSFREASGFQSEAQKAYERTQGLGKGRPTGAKEVFNQAAQGLMSMAPQAIRGNAELLDVVIDAGGRIMNPQLTASILKPRQARATQIAKAAEPYAVNAEKNIQEIAPVDPNDKGFWTATVPSGVGSAAGFALGGLTGRAASMGRIAPGAMAGLLGMGVSAGSAAKEMNEAKVEGPRRNLGILFAAGTGLTEMAGLGKMLDKFGLKQKFIERATSVLEEGGQEGLQQFLENVNAAYVGGQDPKRPLTKDVLTSALAGGVIGAGMQGVDVGVQAATDPRGAAEAIKGAVERVVDPKTANLRRATARGLGRSAPDALVGQDLRQKYAGAVQTSPIMETLRTLEPDAHFDIEEVLNRGLRETDGEDSDLRTIYQNAKQQKTVQEILSVIEPGQQADPEAAINRGLRAQAPGPDLRAMYGRAPQQNTVQQILSVTDPASQADPAAVINRGLRPPTPGPDLRNIYSQQAAGAPVQGILGARENLAAQQQAAEAQAQAAEIERQQRESAAAAQRAELERQANAPTTELPPPPTVSPAQQERNNRIRIARQVSVEAQAQAQQAEAAGDYAGALAGVEAARSAVDDLMKAMRKEGSAGAIKLRAQLKGEKAALDARVGNLRKLAKGAPASRSGRPAARGQAGALATPAPPQAPSAPLLNSIVNPEGGNPKSPTLPTDFDYLAAQQKRGQDNRLANMGILSRIRSLGGIRPGINAGELVNAREKRYPGLLNQNGIPADTLIEYLAEDGYPVDRNDLNTLWDAIDQAAAGKTVLPMDRQRDTRDLGGNGESYSEYLARTSADTGALPEAANIPTAPPVVGAEGPPRRKTERQRVPPRVADEGIAALDARRAELSRLKYDRGGVLPDDLADEFRELGSVIYAYQNEMAGREENDYPPYVKAAPMTPRAKAEFEKFLADGRKMFDDLARQAHLREEAEAYEKQVDAYLADPETEAEIRAALAEFEQNGIGPAVDLVLSGNEDYELSERAREDLVEGLAAAAKLESDRESTPAPVVGRGETAGSATETGRTADSPAPARSADWRPNRSVDEFERMPNARLEEYRDWLDEQQRKEITQGASDLDPASFVTQRTRLKAAWQKRWPRGEHSWSNWRREKPAPRETVTPSPAPPTAPPPAPAKAMRVQYESSTRYWGDWSARAESDGETIRVIYEHEGEEYPYELPVAGFVGTGARAEEILTGSGVPLSKRATPGSTVRQSIANLGLDSALEVRKQAEQEQAKNATSGTITPEVVDAEQTEPVGATQSELFTRERTGGLRSSGETGSARRGGESSKERRAEPAGEPAGKRGRSERGKGRSNERTANSMGESEGPVVGSVEASPKEGQSSKIEDAAKAEIDNSRTPTQPPSATHKPGDFHITDLETAVPSGKMGKLRANMAAIQLLQDLRLEGRTPTSEEQQILSQFTGWGQFPDLFNEHNESGQKLAEERAELKSLLTPEEYDRAKRSTLNAHYTAPQIVQKIWDIARRLGYKGGRVLEPSMGIGYFFGLMPRDLHANSRLSGVELDPTVGAIAELLYPGANIRIGGFEEVKGANNFYDLTVGNVPFGDYKVHDPAYNKYRANIHDYFILKALDKTRPGGIVAVITSTGTMDKADSRIRREMADRANLIAAMRLPEGAFQKNAGTAVVTDLLIFQKREAGEKADTSWVDLGQLPDTDGGAPIDINAYYQAHPEMVLGNLDRQSRLYGSDSSHVSMTEDFEDQLEKAIQSLPENVISEPTSKAFEPKAIQKAVKSQIAEGGFVRQGNQILQRRGDEFVEADFAQKDADRVKKLIDVRDALAALNAVQIAGEDSTSARNTLNRVYDAFVDAHGPIRKGTNGKLLAEDPSHYLLLALESSYNPKTQKATKADIFRKDTIARGRTAGDITTPAEALASSLFDSNKVDLDQMADRLKMSKEKLAQKLVEEKLAFENPQGQWETAEQYLSGNVRKKLIEAQDAARIDSKFGPNVSALQEVQPADIPMENINVRLGASWVPAEDVSKFAAHLLKGSETDFNIKYVDVAGTWLVDYSRTGQSKADSQLARSVYGTDRAGFIDILEAAVNDRPIKIYDKTGPDTSVINPAASEAAMAKVQEVREAFNDWIWSDDERADRLHRYYNDNFNNLRIVEYKGEHYRNADGKFILPGMNPLIALRPNQVKDVWQAVTNGKLLDASEVGAGKTFILGSIAMEWKRLGIARKPAIVVPKSRMGPTVSELQLQYPAAKILSLENSFDKENRKRTSALMATGDYDIIVLSHEQMDKMPMRPEVVNQFIGRELQDIEDRIAEVEAENKKEGDKRQGNRIVKQLEKIKARIEAKLKEALDASEKDNVVFFEDTGIDGILIDEAHAFKSLPVYSRRSQVKGVPATRSDRATNMLMRTQWLMAQNDNKGVVFATGTPVTNTLAEVYNMQRYLQPEVLAERGIENFDAWADVFANTSTSFEYTASGEYKAVSRFAEFVNLPELQQMIRQIMATNFVDEMPWVQRPKKIEHIVTSEMTDEQMEYLKEIRERVETLRKMSPRERKASGDNFLLVSTDARKSALSPRMVSPDSQDSGGKIEKVVENVLRIHKERPDVAQMIFADFGVNPNHWGYSVYGDIKNRLIEGGIPKERIADFGSMSDGARMKAAEKLNNGEYWVAIGSSGKMGTGINAQRRLAAMHHLDAPWIPAFLEQRNGRGHRQGNLNDSTKPPGEQKVEAYYYTTQDSFDVVMWQALNRKSAFINQFMRGDSSIREMRMDDTGDEDSGEISPDMILAATAGNPYEVDRVRLLQDIQKLDRLEKSHRGQQSRMRTVAQEAEKRIPSLQSAIGNYDRDISVYEASKGKEFEVSINGKQYDKRDVAGNQLAIAYTGAPDGRDAVIGQYRGFEIRANKANNVIYLQGPGGIQHTFNLKLGEPENVFASADHTLRNLAGKREQVIERIKQAENDVATAKDQSSAPFKRADELKEKKAKLAETEKKIEVHLAARAEKEKAEKAEKAKDGTRQIDPNAAILADPEAPAFSLRQGGGGASLFDRKQPDADLLREQSEMEADLAREELAKVDARLTAINREIDILRGSKEGRAEKGETRTERAGDARQIQKLRQEQRRLSREYDRLEEVAAAADERTAEYQAAAQNEQWRKASADRRRALLADNWTERGYEQQRNGNWTREGFPTLTKADFENALNDDAAMARTEAPDLARDEKGRFAANNYWRTPMPTKEPQTEKEAEEFVGHARSEFRQRSEGPGTLWINRQSATVIASAMKQLGRKVQSFAGVAVHIDQVRDIIQFLDGRVEAYANGQRIADLLRDLEDAIADAEAHGYDRVAIVDPSYNTLAFNKSTTREERFHRWQSLAGIFSDNVGRGLHEVLKNDPVYTFMRDQLIAEGYAANDGRLLVSEASAKIASGQWREYGLESEQQGMDFLFRYMHAAYRTVGRQLFTDTIPGTARAKEIYQDVQEFTGEARPGGRIPRAAGSGQGTRDAGITPASVRRGDSEGAEGGGGSRSGSVPRSERGRSGDIGSLRGITLESLRGEQSTPPPREPREPRAPRPAANRPSSTARPADLRSITSESLGLPTPAPRERRATAPRSTARAEAPREQVAAPENEGSLRERVFTTIGGLQAGVQLGSPGFVGRNVLQHIGYAVQSGMADRVAQIVDASFSTVTRRPRSVVVPGDPVSNSIRGVKNYIRGVKDAYAKHKAGEQIDGGSVEEVRNMPTNRVAQAVRSVLVYINEIPDAGNYAARLDRRMRILAATAQRNGVTMDEEAMAAIVAQAELEAAHDSMRDNNFVSVSLKKLKEGLNATTSPITGTTRFGIGDFIVKYTQTPGALLKRGIEYSPFGLIEAAMHAGRATMGRGGEYEKRMAMQALGRALSGSASTIGLGAVLAAMGALVEPEKEDFTSEDLERERGVRGFSVNLSALARMVPAMLGGGGGADKMQPGDKLVPIDWAQPWAMGASVGASMYNQVKQGRFSGSTTAGAAAQSFENMMDVMGDQSVLKNLREYIRAAKGRTFGDQAQSVAEKFLKGVPQSFAPSLTRQIGNVVDPKMRDYRPEERGGIKAALQEGGRRAVAGTVPGLSRRYPEKISTITGEPRKTAQGELSLGGRLLNLLSPVIVNEYKADALRDEIIRLNTLLEERDVSLFVPPLTEQQTKKPGYKEPTSLLREREGKFARSFAEQGHKLVMAPAFRSLSDAAKADAIRDLAGNLRAATYKKEQAESVGKIIQGSQKAARPARVRRENQSLLPQYR